MSIIKIVKKQIHLKDFTLGFTLSFGLYFLIVLGYVLVGKAWALSTGFVIPSIMVFFPFGLFVLSFLYENQKLRDIRNVILISVSLTGILGMLFYQFVFDFFDIFGIEKIY